MRLTAKLRDMIPGPRSIVAGEAAGLKLFARGADPDFARGTYETPIQRAISGHLAPGEVFYDIGANIGFFSLIATRRVGAGGQVYAYEPVPRNAAAIARSARINEFSAIRVFAEAVGAANGQTELLLARHIGGATLASVAPPPDMVGRLDVPMTTLDQSIARHGLRPPNLVKIDVEGAEMAVLRGMTETLATHRPDIIYEVDNATRAGLDRTAREIAELMAANGYVLIALPNAYANEGWQVAHMLARPAEAAGRSGSKVEAQHA